MVKYKNLVFTILIIFFLLFSFYPTIFELSRSNKLADPAREFILEHNYYWPDYNLYLSKIRQGFEGRLTALERYTSEPHQGSLIQEFYVALGWLGRFFSLDPNSSYLLGRIILAPLLLLVIVLLVRYFFKPFIWQILAFLITVSSASFPRIFTDASGAIQIGRYMEWWSNIDALQRITFIPHILFGQVVSFFLLYQITKNKERITKKKLLLYIILGNAVGLTFPPSLITLDTVLFLILIIKSVKQSKIPILFAGGPNNNTLNLKRGDAKEKKKYFAGRPCFLSTPTALSATSPPDGGRVERFWEVHKKVMADLSENQLRDINLKLIFLIFTLPSLLYIFLITKFIPWSALIDFHITHPMMIPFDQYILGTGPIFFLGIIGAIISIVKRDKRFQPLIFWILATFAFAAVFSVVRDQSPLRFTQTGLFIPLGLLGSYLFYQIWLGIKSIKYKDANNESIAISCYLLFVICYLFVNLFIMKVSLDWQTTWISQRIGANIPPVPYPPQAMYPLRDWMDGIRWLEFNTDHNDVVLAEITAGNYIPAYSGNTVYFGQSNTVDYDRKQLEVDKFFEGKMSQNEAQLFLANGRIKYIFFSVQEKEKSGGKNLEEIYSFLKPIFSNNLVTIYSY